MTTERERNGPGTAILASLVTGIAVGLFFGEYCAPLGFVGRAFIQLLQMTVLPYIVISLVVNIGRLSVSQARALAQRAGIVLLALWGLGILVVVLLPASFPSWHTGSFFSTSFIEPPVELDLIGLYIPANPFHSMANSIVPATVLFSIFLGVALIGVPDKQPLLDMLGTLVEGLTRISKLVFKLAPIGIFSIAANAAGTMGLEQIGKLQGYLLTYTAAVLVLTFWLIPGLVAAVTPFGYREILSAGRRSLVTAFATGKLFIVLPLLIEDVKRLMEMHNAGPDSVKEAEALVPLAYPFPHLGKITILLFLPFSAWFIGRGLGPEDYPTLLGVGVVSLFGSPLVAVPFLLDLFQLPTDLFQLFVVAGVYCGQLGDGLGAMHLLGFTLLVGCISNGMLQIRLHRIVVYLVASAILLGLTVAGSRFILTSALADERSADRVLRGMKLIEPERPSVLLAAGERNPVPLRPGQTVLERALERGVLRVGFDPEGFPWSYPDDSGKPVGFEVDLMYRLASDVDLSIEFVPVPDRDFGNGLAEDAFDLAIGGIPATVERAATGRLLPSHLGATLALLVRDHRAKEFESPEAILHHAPLRIGLSERTRVVIPLERQLEGSEFVYGVDEMDFIEGRTQDIDAILLSAERGFALTLLYPDFQVVNPFGGRQGYPLAFMVAFGQEDLHARMSSWIEMVKLDGTIDRLYAHWVLGRDAAPHEPRWSVIRNVLGWVD